MKSFLNKILIWAIANKLTAFLVLLVLYLFLGGFSTKMLGGISYEMGNSQMLGIAPSSRTKTTSYDAYEEAAPTPQVQNRRTITKSRMSLQVKDVMSTVDQIKTKVIQVGGYIVESNISTPEYGGSGSVIIRVPVTTLEDTLTYLRDLSVKVVSENISGHDITDEFVDIQSRLNRLNQTKTTFEEMLTKASDIDDILRIQREIFSIQDKIDSYLGKLKYMDGSSSTVLISINLSTDELGLPYAPPYAWRPEAVFKQAYRSLMLNAITVGSAAIWVMVYIPAFLFIFAVYIVIKKIVFRKKPLNKPQF